MTQRFPHSMALCALVLACASACTPQSNNPGVSLGNGDPNNTADGGAGTASGASGSSGAAGSSSGGAGSSGPVGGSSMGAASGTTGGSSGTNTSAGTGSGSTGTPTSMGTSGATSAATSGTTTSSTTNASSGMAPACQSARDCALGNLCLNGACTPGCQNANDCPQNAPFCDPARGANGTCVECQSAMDCNGPNAMCVDGACALGCSQGGDCPFGLQCLAATNTCVRCLADDDCPNGAICEANDCVAGCRVDDDCGNGRLCRNNACVVGCTVMPNSCPPAQICDPAMGAAGQCRPGCNTAQDCGDPQDFSCVQSQCVANCQDDGDCNDNAICQMGACVPGCRPPQQVCADGFYCTATASNTVGQCLRGCDTNDDCGGVENVCNVPTHTCVECLTTTDCTLGGNITATCDAMTLTCQIACQPGQFDLCRTLGFFCDETTMTCVDCTSDADCDAFESCQANRCVSDGNLPLCAPCDTDDQCGGPADLCVNRTVNGRSERVCGTDCSSGQACPSGTACLQVGGGTSPVRGRQCLPVNSVGPTTCAARLDTEGQVECDRGQDCGLFGGSNTPDAICSGAGSSQGMCTVFCTVGGNDCPPGFTCEDPPDTPNQMFRPRCGPM